MNIPCAFLNSNDGSGLLSFGNGEVFIFDSSKELQDLQNFIDQHRGKYIVGYLSYDLKEKLHDLISNNEDHLNFPYAYFWVPAYVVEKEKQEFHFRQGEKNDVSLHFLNEFLQKELKGQKPSTMLEFNSRISKEEYLDKVVAIKNHIQEGNIYELNFCQEYFADNVEIKDSIETYFKLNTITKAPYSAFLQVDDFSVFCGSPERFLKKTERTLISQPIKGTAPRGFTAEKDEQLRSALADDPKERAENIMIVDLVRNDLSRVAAKNSVKVDELCKIYSFETVHQMISTISCEIEQEVNFTDILKATFPMGSMTGAPKLRSMELIESFESFKRGLYSGSLGYIAPNGDFDFNVIIRAVLYNQKSRYLSCAVGSAITIKSDPEMEYEECMVKVKRIMDGING